MSLRYSFEQALNILRRLPPGSRGALDRLCREIQAREKQLNEAAAPALVGCVEACRGLCCRNLQLDAVFAAADFVYILASAPELETRMEACLRRENPLYTSDCLFLEAGVGPCLFPPQLRPEVCITSFCRGDEALKAEIRQVKRSFRRLGVFLWLQKLPPFLRRLP
jgi:hypothetical protein